jgi:hypothetical protein
MVDGVTVDLNSLTTFAHTMGSASGTMAGFRNGSAPTHIPGLVMEEGTPDLTGTMNLATQLQVGGLLSNFSPPGFNEAQVFNQAHGVIASSMQQFFGEATNGYKVLGDGAEMCAMGYASTDQYNAAMLKRVHDENTLKDHGSDDVILTGQGNVTSDDVYNAFNPAPDPNAKKDGTVPANPLAPADNTKSDTNLDTATQTQLNTLHTPQPVGDNRFDGTQQTTIGTGPGAMVLPPDQTHLPTPGQ